MLCPFSKVFLRRNRKDNRSRSIFGVTREKSRFRYQTECSVYVWLVILRNHRHFFLGMRKIEDEEKRWTTPGGGPMCGKTSPSSCLQLSVGRSVISRPSALSGSEFRRNDHRFRELVQEPQQLKFILQTPTPSYYYSTLISTFPVPSPLFPRSPPLFFFLALTTTTQRWTVAQNFSLRPARTDFTSFSISQVELRTSTVS